jgi:Putative zincin peptidase
MEKIKEYSAVPKKYIVLAGIFALAISWIIPVPIISLWKLFLLLIGTVIVLTVVHELLHGIFFKLFTGRVIYGFILKKFVFYASSPNQKISGNKFIVTALAPQLLAIPMFLIMGLVHNPIIDYFTLIFVFANLIGGTSDIWVAMTLAHYKEKVWAEDTKTGLIIYRAT